ncbi:MULTISPECIES: DUF2062 domain-containing protein [Roseobacteraceae]|uniref:DNA-directed RNA polymerase subunit omega n=1 Tax=Pseudosulfitobacter pseudonitzschiae TaxID=1402135 RepID=A0A221K3P5_9RHOB|nr:MULTISPECIES: DUF2062 domain-containing protein [Roseobacteraceae]ASM73467.1 DNA-directed RNA polymerase subunit omega [Pseudosulfitobacter pseudonitzschiae]
MIFKRRDPKPFLRALAEALWPRGGWTRAFHYVKHRMRRLPDTPECIARGIWAGVFTTFTPFYGLHFVVAVIVGKAMRGNLLAALMATFFGNPLTYVPIGIASLQTGNWLLGTKVDPDAHRSFGGKFYDAASDLWGNLIAVVQGHPTDWSGLERFFHEVFFPYLVGGIIPGIICGTIAYYIAVPLLRAYQKRRKGAIKAKFEALKAKAVEKAAAKAASKSDSWQERD